jgi:hypothetical protein
MYGRTIMLSTLIVAVRYLISSSQTYLAQPISTALQTTVTLRCRFVKDMPQLVGGTTVAAGTFSFMNFMDKTIYVGGSGLTCTWIKSTGGAPNVGKCYV